MQSISEIRSLKRIFILLTISLTVAVAAALLYIFDDAKRDRIKDLTYTAKVITSYYELSFHQWELSLLSLGNRLVEIKDPQERLDYANEALKVYEKELLAFGLADTTGLVMTFTGLSVEDSLPNLISSERTRRSFQLAMNQGGLTLGESYYFENVSDWILPIRVPIHNAQNEIVAVNTSAIDYSTMIDELDEFGFDPNYQIQLINNDFGTTQLVYPLDPSDYKNILGSINLTNKGSDTIQSLRNAYLLSGKDPISDTDILYTSSLIDVIDHQLLVSVRRSFLISEFLGRIKYVLVVYLFLSLSAIFLYTYMKRNLVKSIMNLRSEKANLKSIIESTSNIIGLFDTEKRLIEFNSTFNLITKSSEGFELRKNMDLLGSIKNRDQSKLFSKNFDRALAGEKFQIEFTYPTDDKDIIFKFMYNPVYDGENIVGITFFAEDITTFRGYQEKLESYNKDLEREVEERIKELIEKNEELEQGYVKLQSTQQQLIRAEKMASLGILSAGIGHEINNPLNFIKHGTITLRNKLERDLKDFEYDAYFSAIEEGVSRASTIVSGLSHFSRVGDAMDETCEIHQVLDNSLTLLGNRLKSKSITIVKEYGSEDYSVNGNDGKLHQVFTNIINNAEQAIEDKGQIRIKTQKKQNQVVVEISDTGVGMTNSVVQKMQDPFFTTKEPGEGTGLGLFICQMIMDEHNAEMQVSSKLGEGTTFTLTFKSS